MMFIPSDTHLPVNVTEHLYVTRIAVNCSLAAGKAKHRNKILIPPQGRFRGRSTQVGMEVIR